MVSVGMGGESGRGIVGAERELLAWDDLRGEGRDIEEEALDGGVAHSAEGIAVVKDLGAVGGERLTGFEVNDPDGVWGVDDAVGADDGIVPSDVAFVAGREAGLEELGHLGLLHHVVEGEAEGVGGGGVESVLEGVVAEGVVEVAGVADEGEDFVDLVAVTDGIVVELAEEGCGLFGDGDA